jgi:hypothetical protein
MSEPHANKWLAAWRQATLDHLPHNRKQDRWLWILAAQAEANPSLARRMAIVEVLGDGRPHPAPELRTAVEQRLGNGCFAADSSLSSAGAEETLKADIAALGDWDIRIGYSDTSGVEGYYLKDPVVGARGEPGYQKVPDPVQIQIYRSLDDTRKMRSMFEMFEFALQQVRLGTRSRHPDWDDEQVEAEARRLVTGVAPLVE